MEELTVEEVFERYEQIIEERDARIAELERMLEQPKTIYQNDADNRHAGAEGDLEWRGQIKLDTIGVRDKRELPSVQYLQDIFDSKYSELKDSMLTFDYGNILVEHHQLVGNEWEESSLLKSKSDHWMFHFKPFMLIVEKKFFDWLYENEGYLGDDNNFTPTNQTYPGKCLRIPLSRLKELGLAYHLSHNTQYAEEYRFRMKQINEKLKNKSNT